MNHGDLLIFNGGHTLIRTDSTGVTAYCFVGLPMPCGGTARGTRRRKAGHDEQYKNEGNL